MITIKLTSSNYLLRKNHITPILDCQNLLGYIDGSKPAPSPTTQNTAGVSVLNRAYDAWHTQDQRLLSLLLSSLTEESMAEVIGCITSRAVWVALEAAFSHRSKSRELRLKDYLQLMKKGNRTVSGYGRQFKSLCDQLAAIGRPVDETDKAHWFLHGLGSSFSSFSAAQMALTPLPIFQDLLSKVESFSLFQDSLDTSRASSVAFYGQRRRSGPAPHQSALSSSSRGRGNGGGNCSLNTRGRGRGNNRHPPECQICHSERYAQRPPQNTAHLAEAFSAGYSISQPDNSDWFLDTGASAYMTPISDSLDESQPYSGTNRVVVGNGANLSISRIDNSRISYSFKLLDVLVVPSLTKNLLSISKLISDYPIDVLFTNSSFTIQNRQTKEVRKRPS
ncbi:hypothetical protein F511_26729 [Dorcoceras hygrometricum]|uniref:Retrovirus-related Pol polyprotein from transposon TNT 1-94-like beta-barrel domain-containing protein n=1 Tax=Dorcoceras hygrometricum TaxID=472368 RepID=A0A2Z7CGD2_9LAMI|nr:hypothetical protein F511_26729 [Dorcoceras hygrometricum]